MAKGIFNRILDAVGLEEEEYQNENLEEENDFYEEEYRRKRNKGFRDGNRLKSSGFQIPQVSCGCLCFSRQVTKKLSA
jgi:hypothetical protein